MFREPRKGDNSEAREAADATVDQEEEEEAAALNDAEKEVTKSECCQITEQKQVRLYSKF